MYQAVGLSVKRTFTHKPEEERGGTNHRTVCRNSLEGPANTEALRQPYRCLMSEVQASVRRQKEEVKKMQPVGARHLRELK